MRRLLLVVLAAVAYLVAAWLTVLVLTDLPRWGILGSAAMGLLVALFVVLGRGALASLRGGSGEEAGDPSTG